MGYAVKNISPQVKIISLVDDALVLAEGELGAAIDRGGRVFFETHDHGPLHENDVGFHDHIVDFHVELLAALGQSVAHGLEIFDTLNPLDAILEDDLIGIIGENVGPVWFTLFVIGFRP